LPSACSRYRKRAERDKQNNRRLPV